MRRYLQAIEVLASPRPLPEIFSVAQLPLEKLREQCNELVRVSKRPNVQHSELIRLITNQLQTVQTML